jgi:hypothetical protein
MLPARNTRASGGSTDYADYRRTPGMASLFAAVFRLWHFLPLRTPNRTRYALPVAVWGLTPFSFHLMLMEGHFHRRVYLTLRKRLKDIPVRLGYRCVP